MQIANVMQIASENEDCTQQAESTIADFKGCDNVIRSSARDSLTHVTYSSAPEQFWKQLYRNLHFSAAAGSRLLKQHEY